MARRRAASRGGPMPPERGEIYLEYTIVGAQMRAVAIDADSGCEVSVFGPVNVVRDDLGQLAVRKLMRRLTVGGISENDGDPDGARYA